MRAIIFDTLRKNPDWAPKLEQLRVDAQPQVMFIRAAMGLDKHRLGLKIEMVGQNQEKKYGD
jgi:hypothetical protein